VQVATLRAKHAGLAAVFTERSRRLSAATEARAIGHGGIALVERATGISPSTIQRGLRDLDADGPLAGGRTRKAGGGRKRATLDKTLLPRFTQRPNTGYHLWQRLRRAATTGRRDEGRRRKVDSSR
jgi:hypothetical protein